MIDPLYKFCRKEHNLALGFTRVRLGSLYYYRTFNDEEIGDVSEGIKMKGKYLSQSEIQLRDEMPEKSQPKYILEHMMSPNNLLFSTSTNENANFSTYNSCYKIIDPILFSQIIALELIENIMPDDFTCLEPLLPLETLKDIDDIGVEIERHPVIYIGDNEINAELYYPINIPWWKSIKYKNQNEFRFLFKICKGDFPTWFSSIKFDYIDIDLRKHRHKLPIEIC